MARVGDGDRITVLQHVTALLTEMDLRYQQRYEAQIKGVEAAFLAQQTAVQAALTAAEKAVSKAETAAEKRFDAVNEFRGAYQDVIAQQMPRAEAEQRINQLREAIDELKTADSQRVGRSAGIGDGTKILVAVVGLAFTAVNLYLAFHR